MPDSPPPAYVTVTDAAGRVLFRRLATAAEIEEAMQIAKSADSEAEEVLKRIAHDRERALAAQARVAEARAKAEATALNKPAEESVAPTKVEAAAPEETVPFDSFDIPEPDFTDTTSARKRDEPKDKEEEQPAFQAFGDEELDFLSGLNEEKGK